MLSSTCMPGGGTAGVPEEILGNEAIRSYMLDICCSVHPETIALAS
jgi:hypothetical protein